MNIMLFMEQKITVCTCTGKRWQNQANNRISFHCSFLYGYVLHTASSQRYERLYTARI